MYAKVSDGIFLEVGGTSTDISVIKNGKPQVKSAQIGGNRLFLRALDVRTLGIAGGSVPRIAHRKIVDVGPRSAHIANLHYPSFEHHVSLKNIQIKTIQPRNDDPSDYLAIQAESGSKNYTLTPTEASHYLEYAGDANADTINKQSVVDIFDAVSMKFETKPDTLAKKILEISSLKIKPTIKQLMREYKLDADFIQFVGGGGGAPAIVPAAANYMHFPYMISQNTDVISAIGAALGIIRDTVEKTVMNPKTEDIITLRQKAISSVRNMGADPDTIEASVEVDAKNNRIIATATGSGEMRTKDLNIKKLGRESIIEIAARSMKNQAEYCEILLETESLFLVNCNKTTRRIFARNKIQNQVRVIDKEGVVKLQLKDAEATITTAQHAIAALNTLIESLTSYGDAGALLPGIYCVIGSRIIDMTGLIEEKQIQALLTLELEHLLEQEAIAIIGVIK